MAQCTDLGRLILDVVAVDGVLAQVDEDIETVMDNYGVTNLDERTWFMACINDVALHDALENLWAAYEAGRAAERIPNLAGWGP